MEGRPFLPLVVGQRLKNSVVSTSDQPPKAGEQFLHLVFSGLLVFSGAVATDETATELLKVGYDLPVGFVHLGGQFLHLLWRDRQSGCEIRLNHDQDRPVRLNQDLIEPFLLMGCKNLVQLPPVIIGRQALDTKARLRVVVHEIVIR